MTEVTRSGDQTDIAVIVSGEGYNGPGVLAFQTRSERIQRLIIS